MSGLVFLNDFLRVRQCRHGYFAFNVNDLAVGRSLDLYGEWCEAELALLGSLLQAGDVVLDIGANIGTHTLFFAKAAGPAGQVIAFEPQMHSFNLLVTNVTLNCIDTVYPFRMAVSDVAGRYVFPRLDPRVPQNFGMVDAHSASEGDSVAGTTIDSFQMARCNLIKVDVEGAEYEVLAGALNTLRSFRPLLYVENDRPANSARLIALLSAQRYRCYWHLTSYYNPDNFAGNPNNGFGELLSVNMLCVPEESGISIHGDLEPAQSGDTPAAAVRRRFGTELPLEARLVFAAEN